MSKKYLSIEEAAEHLGIASAELNRLREKGVIRAFADRGTWKFKEEDVEKLGRSRQADSDPDVPLHQPDDEGSGADLLFTDEDALGSQPTIISKKTDDTGSDSDVRLIFDDSLQVSESKARPVKDDSDSDVKLAGAPAAPADDSDSDVKLAPGTPTAPADDSDSDVKLAGTAEGAPGGGSDSDVKLVTDDMPTKASSGSDSDVRLVSSDSSGEVKLAGSSASIPVVTDDEGGSTIMVDPAGSSSVIESESGISLGEGSDIPLASDSGISLERPNDSGISLSDESSIVLSEDSGISLAGEKSSVIKSDSGISLSKQPPGRKKGAPTSPSDSDDLTGTVPLMDAPLAQDEDLLDTQMEVPSLGDSSDSGELFGSGSGEGDSTNVITLDDEEDAGYDVTSEIPRGAAALEDEEEAVIDDETVDVSDDLVGEDDELAEDVFGAEDEDFASDEESGESLSELPVAPRGMVAAAEQDWGMGTHIALVTSAVLMVACGTVLFDMVRNMWHTDAASHNPVASMLLDMFKSM
jgi:excisionase family DNA binding protein